MKPSISVDMRKGRIRIHKHTLHALGDPDFVAFIVNPKEYVIGITCSGLDDKLAHRVRKRIMATRECYELYSKSFVAALHELCPGWDGDGTYRLEGKVIEDENMVVFFLHDDVRGKG